MTWKRQFFEIALFMHTDLGSTGVTEVQYRTYGIDYYVRTKFIEEDRASVSDLLSVYNNAVTRCADPTTFSSDELLKIATTTTFKSATVTKE